MSNNLKWSAPSVSDSL